MLKIKHQRKQFDIFEIPLAYIRASFQLTTVNDECQEENQTDIVLGRLVFEHNNNMI